MFLRIRNGPNLLFWLDEEFLAAMKLPVKSRAVAREDWGDWFAGTLLVHQLDEDLD